MILLIVVFDGPPTMTYVISKASHKKYSKKAVSRVQILCCQFMVFRCEDSFMECLKNKKPVKQSFTGFKQVEVRRIELLSKHIRQKLSTCLFTDWLSGKDRTATNQFFP